MKVITISTLLLIGAAATLAGASAPHANPEIEVVPGHSAVDSSRLKPYTARWLQLNRSSGQLADTGTVFTETLQTEGNVIRHTQSVSRENATVLTEERLLDRQTLRSLALERRLHDGPPDRASTVSVALADSAYVGSVVMGDGTTKPFHYAPPTAVFDGWIAGLVLAALPLDAGYMATLPAVVHLQQATYQLKVAVRGLRDHELASGVTVPVWVVDSTWVNMADGAISAGGPERSGGTYYVAVKPGNGVPYVVEYANDAAVIRWLP